MRCRFADLRCKEVINIHNGFRLGFVYDMIIDVVTGHMAAILIPGPCKFFGAFGREDDYLIPWECIKKLATISYSSTLRMCSNAKNEGSSGGYTRAGSSGLSAVLH